MKKMIVEYIYKYVVPYMFWLFLAGVYVGALVAHNQLKLK